MQITFPALPPIQSPSNLWQVQLMPLNIAERFLGPKNEQEICQPVFTETGPQLVFAVNRNCAFATLSMNAANYWPTTFYELAHETVHLLHPIAGNASVLEEGIAVLFAELASSWTEHPMSASISCYREAASLAVNSFAHPFKAASLIRAYQSSLTEVRPELLLSLFPNLSSQTAEVLCSKCIY